MRVKKISLENTASPMSIDLLDEKTKVLTEKIIEVCKKSELSYVEKNKALHQADATLYYGCINKGS